MSYLPKEGAPLSEREKQVAVRVAEGKSIKEIACELGVGYETIKKHLARIRAKLGVKKSTQVAVWAAENLTRSSK